MDLLAHLFGHSSSPSIDPGRARAKMGANPKPYVLDVRQPDEYEAGHIPGATLIPLPELTARLRELPLDREIICVCRSGSRSRSATRQLAAAGYNAVNLQGGMINWSLRSFPVTKSGGK